MSTTFDAGKFSFQIRTPSTVACSGCSGSEQCINRANASASWHDLGSSIESPTLLTLDGIPARSGTETSAREIDDREDTLNSIESIEKLIEKYASNEFLATITDPTQSASADTTTRLPTASEYADLISTENDLGHAQLGLASPTVSNTGSSNRMDDSSREQLFSTTDAFVDSDPTAHPIHNSNEELLATAMAAASVVQDPSQPQKSVFFAPLEIEQYVPHSQLGADRVDLTSGKDAAAACSAESHSKKGRHECLCPCVCGGAQVDTAKLIEEKKKLAAEVRRLTLAVEEHRLAAVERAGELADMQSRAAKDLREYQRKVADLQLQLEEAQAKAKRLERDRSEREFGGYSSRNEALAALNRLSQENAALMQRVTTLERECERTKAEAESRQESLRGALEKAVTHAAAVRSEDAATIRSELTAVYTAEISAIQRTAKAERDALEAECQRLRHTLKEREEWWQAHAKERAVQLGAEAKQDRVALEEREQLLQRLQQQERQYCEERLQTLRTENDTLRTELTQEREERARLHQQLRASETELTKLRVRTEELNTMIASLRADVATADESRRQLVQAHNRELAAQQRAIAAAEQAREEAISQAEAKLKAHIEAWNKERAELQREIQNELLKREDNERSATRDWARSKEEVERREAAKRRTERELWRKERDAALAQQASEHQAAMLHAQHRYIELEKVCKDLRDHCENLRNELTARAVEHATEVQTLRAKIDDLQYREERAREETRRMHQELQARIAEAELYEAERRRAEARLAEQLEEVKKAYKGQSAELRQEREQLERTHREREAQLQREAQQRLERIERQAAEREAELRDRIADLSESLSRAQTQLQQAQVQAQTQVQLANLMHMQDANNSARGQASVVSGATLEEKLRLEQKKRLEAAQAFELTERALQQRLEDARLAAMRESAAAAARLQAAEANARKEQEALLAKIEQMEAECTATKDALAATQAALERAAETRRSLERDLERANDSHARELERIKTLHNKELAHVRELAAANMEGLQKEHQQQLKLTQQESRTREQAAEDRARSAAEQLAQLKVSLERMMQERAQLAESLSLAEMRIDELEQVRSQLTGRIKELQSELGSREQEIEKLLEQSAASARESQRRLDALGREHQISLASIQHEVAEAEKRNRELQAEVEKLRTSLHDRELRAIREADELERSHQAALARVKSETRMELDRALAAANERAIQAETSLTSERARAEAEQRRADAAERKLTEEKKAQALARFELQEKYTRLLRRVCTGSLAKSKSRPTRSSHVGHARSQDTDGSLSADESLHGLYGECDLDSDESSSEVEGQPARAPVVSRSRKRQSRPILPTMNNEVFGLELEISKLHSSLKSREEELEHEKQRAKQLAEELDRAQETLVQLMREVSTLHQAKVEAETIAEVHRRARDSHDESKKSVTDDMENKASDLGPDEGAQGTSRNIRHLTHQSKETVESSVGDSASLQAMANAANAAAALAAQRIAHLEGEVAHYKARLEEAKVQSIEEAKRATRERTELERLLRHELDQADASARETLRKVESELKRQILHLQAELQAQRLSAAARGPLESTMVPTTSDVSATNSNLLEEHMKLVKATQAAVQEANDRARVLEEQLEAERGQLAPCMNAYKEAQKKIDELQFEVQQHVTEIERLQGVAEEERRRHLQLIAEQQHDIAEREQRLEDVALQRDQLNLKLGELVENCKQLQARIEELVNERDLARAEIEAKALELSREQASHHRTREELKEMEQAVERARQATGLAKAEALVAGLNQTVKEREKLLRARETELDEVRAEIARMSQRLAAEEEKKARVEREYERAKQDIESARETANRERERAEEAELQHRRQCEKLEEALKQALAKQRDEEAKRDKAERELRVRITELTEEFRKREEEANAKAQEAEARALAHADRCAEIQQLLDAARAREKRIQDIQLESSVAQSKATALTSELEAMRARLQQASSALKSEQEESERQRTQIQQLQSALERAKATREAEAQASAAHVQQLEAKLDEKDRQLADVQLKEQRAQNELRRLSEKLATAEAELETVQERLSNLRDSEEGRVSALYAENTKLQIEAQQLKSEIRSLESEKSLAKLAQDDLIQRLQQAEAKVKVLESELASHAEQRVNWTKERAELQRTIQDIRTQLEHCRVQLQTRTDELADVRSKLVGVTHEKDNLERALETARSNAERALERLREQHAEELAALRMDGNRAAQDQGQEIMRLRADAKAAREEFEAERERLLQKNGALSRELEAAKAEIAQRGRDIAHLQSQAAREVEILNRRIAQLTEQEKALVEQLERERALAEKEATRAAQEARERVAQVEQQLREAAERADAANREAEALVKKLVADAEQEQQRSFEKIQQLTSQIEQLENKVRALLAEERQRADSERVLIADIETKCAAQVREARAEQQRAQAAAQATKDELARERERCIELQENLRVAKEAEGAVRAQAAERELALIEKAAKDMAEARAAVLREAEAEAERLRDSINRLTDAKTRAEQQLQLEQNRLHEMELTKAALDNELKSALVELRTANARAEDLALQLSQLKAERARLVEREESRQAQLASEITELQKALKDADANAVAAQHRVKVQEKELDRYRDELHQTQRRIQQLEDEKQESERNVRAVQAQLVAAQAETARLTSELARANADIGVAVAAREADLAAWQREREDASRQLAVTTQGFAERIEALSRELDERESKIQAQVTEITQLVADRERLQARLKAAAQEAEARVKQAGEQGEASEARLRAALVTVEAENSALKDKVVRLENDIARATSSEARAHAILREREAEVDAKNEELKQLHAQLTAKTQEFMELHTDLIRRLKITTAAGAKSAKALSAQLEELSQRHGEVVKSLIMCKQQRDQCALAVRSGQKLARRLIQAFRRVAALAIAIADEPGLDVQTAEDARTKIANQVKWCDQQVARLDPLRGTEMSLFSPTNHEELRTSGLDQSMGDSRFGSSPLTGLQASEMATQPGEANLELQEQAQLEAASAEKRAAEALKLLDEQVVATNSRIAEMRSAIDALSEQIGAISGLPVNVPITSVGQAATSGLVPNVPELSFAGLASQHVQEVDRVEFVPTNQSQRSARREDYDQQTVQQFQHVTLAGDVTEEQNRSVVSQASTSSTQSRTSNRHAIIQSPKTGKLVPPHVNAALSAATSASAPGNETNSHAPVSYTREVIPDTLVRTVSPVRKSARPRVETRWSEPAQEPTVQVQVHQDGTVTTHITSPKPSPLAAITPLPPPSESVQPLPFYAGSVGLAEHRHRQSRSRSRSASRSQSRSRSRCRLGVSDLLSNTSGTGGASPYVSPESPRRVNAGSQGLQTPTGKRPSGASTVSTALGGVTLETVRQAPHAGGRVTVQVARAPISPVFTRDAHKGVSEESFAQAQVRIYASPSTDAVTPTRIMAPGREHSKDVSRASEGGDSIQYPASSGSGLNDEVLYQVGSTSGGSLDFQITPTASTEATDSQIARKLGASEHDGEPLHTVLEGSSEERSGPSTDETNATTNAHQHQPSANNPDALGMESEILSTPRARLGYSHGAFSMREDYPGTRQAPYTAPQSAPHPKAVSRTQDTNIVGEALQPELQESVSNAPTALSQLMEAYDDQTTSSEEDKNEAKDTSNTSSSHTSALSIYNRHPLLRNLDEVIRESKKLLAATASETPGKAGVGTQSSRQGSSSAFNTVAMVAADGQIDYTNQFGERDKAESDAGVGMPSTLSLSFEMPVPRDAPPAQHEARTSSKPRPPASQQLAAPGRTSRPQSQGPSHSFRPSRGFLAQATESSTRDSVWSGLRNGKSKSRSRSRDPPAWR